MGSTARGVVFQMLGDNKQASSTESRLWVVGQMLYTLSNCLR
uniref:Uncharacterized protein n=1 Tax=Anguilla anguilla TaxID=7936 RepID=A0A0E9V083_ANGAN